jgi:hypothetical protein
VKFELLLLVCRFPTAISSRISAVSLRSLGRIRLQNVTTSSMARSANRPSLSVGAGRRVSVFKIDPGTGERLGLLATATLGNGGWVDLTEPIIVRAGENFIAVPEQAG